MRGSVVPTKFFLVLLFNTLSAEPEFNAFVLVSSGEENTRGMTRIMRFNTAQTQSILDKTCDYRTPLDSCLHQAMRQNTAQRTIHALTPFHPVGCCRLVSDVQCPWLLSPHSVHFSLFFLLCFPLFFCLVFPFPFLLLLFLMFAHVFLWFLFVFPCFLFNN